MISFTEGNLFDSDAEALVNTVNTVGVMGKGIALMFKERFAENYALYRAACEAGEVATGKMFVTDTRNLVGPRWVINFPTKRHWRSPSRLEWITDGLEDLRRVLNEQSIRSVAIPPLGAGNGGLDWTDVKERVVSSLGDLDIDIVVFEPTGRYMNTPKRKGVELLTPSRALVAELVRRYWVLGMECSLLEVQKLMWLMERAIARCGPASGELGLDFRPSHYGPYAQRLQYVINDLDGSYLHCDRRIGDARPLDAIWFDDERADELDSYLNGEGREYLPALEQVTALIDGFDVAFRHGVARDGRLACRRRRCRDQRACRTVGTARLAGRESCCRTQESPVRRTRDRDRARTRGRPSVIGLSSVKRR